MSKQYEAEKAVHGGHLMRSLPHRRRGSYEFNSSYPLLQRKEKTLYKTKKDSCQKLSSLNGGAFCWSSVSYNVSVTLCFDFCVLVLLNHKHLLFEPKSEPYREIASPLLRLVFLAISLVGTIQHTSFCAHNCIA